MDNVGDWLYIVLLIIASISSLFGSKDKKGKNRPEILGRPDTDFEQYDEPFEEKEETKRNPILMDEEKIPEHITHIHSKREIKENIQVDTDKMPEDVNITPEELRKAVIYTEILNRKY